MRKAYDIIHLMSKSVTPSILPILRSRQQASILAWLLDDPLREVGISDLSRILNIPQPSVSRDVLQAEKAGIVQSRKIGRNRLVSANSESVFFRALRELLVRAFGAPGRLNQVLRKIAGVEGAFIFGSWAARYLGVGGSRPIGDIDVLVLGSPNENEVYAAVSALREELGYDIQVTIRDADWLETGNGSFHDTILSRPMVDVFEEPVHSKNDDAVAMASAAH